MKCYFIIKNVKLKKNNKVDPSLSNKSNDSAKNLRNNDYFYLLKVIFV